MGILTSYIGNQMGTNPAANTGDFLANYFGQQLGANTNNPQANIQPQSTTINYNQDGSAEVTHKQTVGANSVPQTTAPAAPATYDLPQSYQTAMVNPQPQPAPQPVPGMQPFQNAVQATNAPAQVPQATAPVAPPQPQPYVPPRAPQGVFGNMIQAESGGQQYNPQGGVLTSPKGAVGIAQVMPSTAAQPGYGVAPATPQELATPQGNMLFGQRYFEGMYNKFGQDPEKAAAAYNAGPATIERAMQTADQHGGTWKDYIPAETKGYLTKVFPKGEENIKKIQPLIAGTAGSDIGMTPEEQAIHHMVLNSGDVNALGMGTYAGDHLISKEGGTKYAYADQHATVLEQNKLQKEAEKKAQQIVMDGGVGLQRALKDDSEEGSYLKAYLFQRLGLHDLAKNEQQKLGAGDMWAQTMVNGAPAWVKFNGQGAPVKGYNSEGELSGKDLINTLNMKGVTTHTGKMQDIETNKIYYEQTTPFGPRLVDNQGNVFTGDSSKLRAYGIGSDIATKNILQLQQLRNDLLNKPLQEQANFLAKFNAENGTNYSLPQVINSQAPMTAGPNQAPVTGGQPAPSAPQPGAVEINQQGGTATIPAQGAVAPQAAPARALVAGPAVPGQAPQAAPAQVKTGPTPQAGTAPSPYPGIPGVGAPPVPFANESPAAFASRKKAYDEELAKHAADVAKIKEALPNTQAQADQMLNTVNDVINHPGFETNVGLKGVTGYLQLPGTEARNWKAKYDQLMGQEFLDAFSGLKGGGAISDKEGAAATKARAALSDPGISETEFKRNAQILTDTIKRGINRQRMMAGEEPDPKYMLGNGNEEENAKAYDWLKKHPNDKNAPAVRQRLGI